MYTIISLECRKGTQKELQRNKTNNNKTNWGQSKLKFGKSRRALNFLFCQCQAGTTELQDNNSNKLKGVISTGQTRLRFGSVWFSSVHSGHMRGQNHVRFTLVQYGVC